MSSPADRSPGRASPEVERLLRAHLAEPVAASTPRRAATVVLLRPDAGRGGFEVFVMLRAATLAHAAGHVVFPGGSADPDDALLPTQGAPGWSADWAARLDGGEDDARSLAGCAARELFEETGVLLTRDAPPASDDPRIARLRADLLAGSTSFAAVLDELGLVLDPGLLLPWARWVTPQWSRRRYDTLVLLAALPQGAVPARDGGGEATAVAWRRPADLLDLAEDGAVRMLTPTSQTLRDLRDLDPAEVDVLPDTRPSLAPATSSTTSTTPPAAAS